MAEKTKLARFSISLPETLMRTLDRLRFERGYENRSEYVRDLWRAELVKEEWQEQRSETVGVLTLDEAMVKIVRKLEASS